MFIVTSSLSRTQTVVSLRYGKFNFPSRKSCLFRNIFFSLSNSQRRLKCDMKRIKKIDVKKCDERWLSDEISALCRRLQNPRAAVAWARWEIRRKLIFAAPLAPSTIDTSIESISSFFITRWSVNNNLIEFTMWLTFNINEKRLETFFSMRISFFRSSWSSARSWCSCGQTRVNAREIPITCSQRALRSDGLKMIQHINHRFEDVNEKIHFVHSHEVFYFSA